ncbi:uncharacterized protein LOC126909530 [Daktulosphaira vitifoliae]|uniref:uncharacterized protein LOC126909530 n=1 Tax=Daktulosphaira vitifoliae TaxID=58002 RepID=UPI0021AAF499|nr:uncharacterized protein LOC126909530 [Daktulosphaira vitifoliae]
MWFCWGMLLITCQNIFMERIKVSVSSGAFFNEIQEAMMYDKSIPLTYTQIILEKEKTNVGESLAVEGYCKNKDTNYCNIINQSLVILKNINKNMWENQLDLNDFNFNKRSKRGIQFLGNGFHFCCNVATEKQLKNFYSNEQILKDQFNKLKDVFTSDHKDLNDITSQLNNYTSNTNIKIELLKTAFQKINDENRNNARLEDNNLNNSIQGIQEILFTIMSVFSKLIDYERMSNAHLHCKNNKIPPRVLSTDILYKDLLKLQKTINKDGYELVIPIKNLHSYYNLPIAECQFSETQILLKIKIPIKESNSMWKLFQYIPAHFKFHDSICLIFSEKTYIAVNEFNDEHRVVSGVGLQHCDPPVTDLCFIPKFSADVTLSPRCVEAIYKNLPLEQINQVCYFQCIKHIENDYIIIKQIGVNSFVITNPQPNLKVRTFNDHNYTETELDINYDYPDLIKITLSCEQELIRNNNILIPKMYPCEKINKNTLKILRILPISWTNIKSLKIKHDDPEAIEKFYFNNISEILNKNWTSVVPNFHITKQINSDEYFKDIMLKSFSIPLIDNFLGDIIYISWLSLLTLVMAFSIYKIYPMFIKVDVMGLPPPIPPKYQT